MQSDGQVSTGLNLTLELRNPRDMGQLLRKIRRALPQAREALKELHFVHFARFLPTRDHKALLVITEFDGDLEPYVMDFAVALGEVFTIILSYVKCPPHLPVCEHPQEFWAFVQKNNRVEVPCAPDFPFDPWPLFSAYPKKTVLDIIVPRPEGDLPPDYQDAAESPPDTGDVQANVLKRYRAKFARHFALKIRDAQAARDFLAKIEPSITRHGAIVNGTERQCLNIGFTHRGLKMLGVCDSDLATFPVAFQQGPADGTRAKANGDIGPSDPWHWRLGGKKFGVDQPVHVLISVYTRELDVLETHSETLRQMWSSLEDGPLELTSLDAATMGAGNDHFRYRDGIAQPRIAGVLDDEVGPDMQRAAGVGEFLLGSDYTSVYGGRSIGHIPKALAQNGTFAAVRIMKQDVEQFEELLDAVESTHRVNREVVAAKMMGRWRDGTPLTLEPTREAPPVASPIAPPSNEFDYAPTPRNPSVVDDYRGAVCPIGSHIRRMNPRAATVAGKPYTRRLLRRGMPYTLKKLGPDEKGLFGIFICADLERQYEFLLKVWANGDIAAPGIRGTQDPILGAQSPNTFSFEHPDTGAAVSFTVPRLVTTRGSVYLFMPGIAGLKHLAGLSKTSPPTGAARPFDPKRFDPDEPSFEANPYPAYAQFRAHELGAHWIERHKSFWVFRHDLVTEVCEKRDLFLKLPPGDEPKGRGLFYMDPPRHTEVRALLNQQFQSAIADANTIAQAHTQNALNDICEGQREFDLVSDFAKRVALDVFLRIFGIPQDQGDHIDGWADQILDHYDKSLPLHKRVPTLVGSVPLRLYLRQLRRDCPAQGANGLMCRMKNLEDERLDPAERMSAAEVRKTALNFALGGYLSTQFLITTGVYNLLRDGGAAMQRLRDEPALMKRAVAEMLRFDAPFQMADRYANTGVHLGGVRIEEGQCVVVVFGSANRDGQRFDRPDEFDITREPDEHNYALGHGDHSCIGARLVETVVPIALKGLLERLPELRLATTDAPPPLRDPYFRSYDELKLLR
jgi:cytochrome P450/deferrochelatase/peroxidase EfeB